MTKRVSLRLCAFGFAQEMLDAIDFLEVVLFRIRKVRI
jgi:hypothetical protein